ncbi:MAG TPA: hypothetical protein VK760_01690 [Candidatus Acidoferrales bacterium]|nr:hypothetical protein [Candidatus Acidoferrales bacterium]
MLNRTKIGQALVGAAFLATAACHGGSSTLPATPLNSGAIQAPAIGSERPDVKLGKLKVTPATIAFTATGAASKKTIVANEKNYTGVLKVATTCGSAVTVTPAKANGPKATFTVTPVAAIASCTLTVSDTKKHKATAKISVTLPKLNVNPASLSFDAVGAAYATTFAITQTGTGAFKQTNTCSAIATIASASLKAPSATVTVTPKAAGTCSITVADAYGQTKPVAITVTTSGIIIQ